jgi:hypothetical protein
MITINPMEHIPVDDLRLLICIVYVVYLAVRGLTSTAKQLAEIVDHKPADSFVLRFLVATIIAGIAYGATYTV